MDYGIFSKSAFRIRKPLETLQFPMAGNPKLETKLALKPVPSSCNCPTWRLETRQVNLRRSNLRLGRSDSGGEGGSRIWEV